MQQKLRAARSPTPAGILPPVPRMIAERERRRGVATLVRRLASGGAVLGYHSVADAGPGAGSSMHVPLKQVIATIRLLRGVATIVPLRVLLQRHRDGRSTSGLVALTFDDAYVALTGGLTAHLLAHDVPATLFVVTGAARAGDAFWWDRVEDLAPRITPSRWRAFEEACGLPASYRAGQPTAFGAVRPMRQWILAEHAGRWPSHLEHALHSLEAEHDATTTQRSMTFDEIAHIARPGLLDVGVHTVSHPVLPLISDADITAEIRRSHDELRERYAEVLPVLAIPFGLFDERTLRLATRAGMTACLTLTPRPLDPRATTAVPRFCMTRGHTPWKVLLRTLGCWPGLTARAAAAYPALPSATT